MHDPPRDYYRADRSEMLPFVPRHATRILEVGCGEGAFMRLLRSDRPGAEVSGLEIEAEVAAVGRRDGLDIAVGSFPESVPADRRYDCVIFNDVLEHLVDPWAALEHTRTLLGRDGCVVASLPNIRHLGTLHEIAVAGDFHYQPEGVLDSTHLRFFTLRSARRLFEESGFRVLELHPIRVERRPPRRQLAFYAALSAMSRSFARESRIRQFAVVARPR